MEFGDRYRVTIVQMKGIFYVAIGYDFNDPFSVDTNILTGEHGRPRQAIHPHLL